MRIPKIIAASALGLVLAVGQAYSAQSPATGGANGQPHEQMGEPQTGGQPGMQNGMGSPSVGQIGEMQAPTPEYWVADASIFLNSASITAEVLQEVAELDQHSGEIIGNQAQFLQSSIDRAINSLQALQADAQEANPEAASAIQETLTQLQEANQSAGQLVQASQGEALGAEFSNNLEQTSQSLQEALQTLNQVATAYNANRLLPGEAS